MSIRILECIHINNPCYVKYHSAQIQPTGITVHSTDKAGKVIKRFCQPADGQESGLRDNGVAISRARMLGILGNNYNANDWNRAYIDGNPVEKAVHAFIGTLADGSYAVCKNLEYTQPVWAAYKGPNGSYDGRLWTSSGQIAGGLLHVQFEMIEDSAGDLSHCHNLYWTAVEFCAYLCRQYPSIRLDNIVSHREAALRGYASDHGDPENYWRRCGADYTMDGFRADVRAMLEQSQEQPTPTPKPEQPSESGLPFSDVSGDEWFADALRWAVDHKVVLPTTGPFYPDRPMDKATFVVLLRRAYNALLNDLK